MAIPTKWLVSGRYHILASNPDPGMKAENESSRCLFLCLLQAVLLNSDLLDLVLTP
jgi:hypothetical protein